MAVLCYHRFGVNSGISCSPAVSKTMGFVEVFEVISLYLFSRNSLELDLDYEYMKKWKLGFSLAWSSAILSPL